MATQYYSTPANGNSSRSRAPVHSQFPTPSPSPSFLKAPQPIEVRDFGLPTPSAPPPRSTMRPGAAGFLSGSPYKPGKIHSSPIRFPSSQTPLTLSSLQSPAPQAFQRPRGFETTSDQTNITVTFQDPETTNIVIKSPPNARTTAKLRTSGGLPLDLQNPSFTQTSSGARPPPLPQTAQRAQTFTPMNSFSSTASAAPSASSAPASVVSSSPPSTASLISLAIENDFQLAERAQRIRDLQGELEGAYEAGAVEQAGEIAQQIATEKKQMKLRTLSIEQFLQRREMEQIIRQEIANQLKNLQGALTERSLELENLKTQLRGFFLAKSSLKSSMSFGSSSASSASLADQGEITAFLPKARKFLKEIQILLEQSCFVLDSLEVSSPEVSSPAENSQDFPLDVNFPHFPFPIVPGEHKRLMAAFAEEKRMYLNEIQQLLSGCDEMGRYLEEFERFLNFLAGPTTFRHGDTKKIQSPHKNAETRNQGNTTVHITTRL